MMMDRWVTFGLALAVVTGGWALGGCAVREPLPAVPGPTSLSGGGGFDLIEVPPGDAGSASAGMDGGPAEEDPVVRSGAATQPAVGVSEPATEPVAARTYTIRKGDRLWKIAQQEYGDGQRWVDILEANPGLDPKRMTVGEEIVLP
ncbi:MAG: LysM peptidoglycan-binding domain-containing protein [Planctomycetota bacterium]